MHSASRILIVEDQETLGENIRSYLGRTTLDVRLARDAAQALEIVESFAPDVVVVDYGLPGMNGLETYLEMVRGGARRIGCVMITGYPRDSIAPRANERGIRYVLSKPFRLSELRTLVDISAEEACADPPVPFVRCRETRRAADRRNPSARSSASAPANGGRAREVERRSGERRQPGKRRRAKKSTDCP